MQTRAQVGAKDSSAGNVIKHENKCWWIEPYAIQVGAKDSSAGNVRKNKSSVPGRTYAYAYPGMTYRVDTRKKVQEKNDLAVQFTRGRHKFAVFSRLSSHRPTRPGLGTAFLQVPGYPGTRVFGLKVPGRHLLRIASEISSNNDRLQESRCTGFGGKQGVKLPGYYKDL
jgi:hypothetical protein